MANPLGALNLLLTQKDISAQMVIDLMEGVDYNGEVTNKLIGNVLVKVGWTSLPVAQYIYDNYSVDEFSTYDFVVGTFMQGSYVVRNWILNQPRFEHALLDIPEETLLENMDPSLFDYIQSVLGYDQVDEYLIKVYKLLNRKFVSNFDIDLLVASARYHAILFEFLLNNVKLDQWGTNKMIEQLKANDDINSLIFALEDNVIVGHNEQLIRNALKL